MIEKLKIYKSWYDQHASQIQNDYFTFLSFPSISTDPAFKVKTRQTADWLAEHLKKMGLNIEIWEGPGHPCIYASSPHDPSKPTVLIYGHYDVQPVDPLELWKSDPFKPEVREGQVYARGAQDNKGQCFYAVTAISAYLKLAQKGINIKVFIEGEEECGSRSTFAILKERGSQLKADNVLIVDFGIPAPGVPGIDLGMRGLISMNVELRTAKIDLHSGTHGGVVLNSNRALVTLLSKLWDATGKVAIPGFYDDVTPVSQAELEEIDLSFDKEAYFKNFGVTAFSNEEGYSIRESNWFRPTLELNGIAGGYAGAGFKTVIPAMAIAKISCRLVPNQDPQKIGQLITDFFKKNAPSGVDIKVTILDGSRAFRGSPKSKIVQMAAKAYEDILGQPCTFSLSGATVPVVGALAEITGGGIALIGYGLPSDDIHAPNEHFGLDRFEQGFMTVSHILEQLSN